MITEKDLQEAIAECQGQRNPNASTAIKLAAFLTIQKEMFGKDEPVPSYSFAAPQAENQVEIESGTEFARLINGMDARDAWAVMDELMDTLAAINPRLYNGVMRELRK